MSTKQKIAPAQGAEVNATGNVQQPEPMVPATTPEPKEGDDTAQTPEPGSGPAPDPQGGLTDPAPSTAATYGKTPEEITPAAPAGRGRRKVAEAPSVPEAIEAEARKILSDYPDEGEVHMTSDGFGFFDRHDAVNHAARLDDRDVVTVKREE